MIPDEYSQPQRLSQGDSGCAVRVDRGVAQERRFWAVRIGTLAALVFVGVICLGLLTSNTIKDRVLVGVANTYADRARAYSFLKRHYGTPAKSAETVAACERLVKLKPQDPGAQVLLGNAYVDAGRVQEAIVCYREAVSLDADCFEAHLGLGRAHSERGAYGEAIHSYERALRLRPGSADAHLSLGIALSSEGRYDEAMQAFKRAKELDPQVTETQILTGRAYLQAGMYAQAIECLKDAVRTDEQHAQAYYNLGRAYLRVGDRDLAMEQQHKLQGLNPVLADQLLSLMQQ
jgi:tetratricopeptide (TPR) repeat protein